MWRRYMKKGWGLLIRKQKEQWWELVGPHWELPLFPAPQAPPPSKPQEVRWDFPVAKMLQPPQVPPSPPPQNWWEGRRGRTKDKGIGVGSF